jgi:hypothetical protein
MQPFETGRLSQDAPLCLRFKLVSYDDLEWPFSEIQAIGGKAGSKNGAWWAYSNSALVRPCRSSQWQKCMAVAALQDPRPRPRFYPIPAVIAFTFSAFPQNRCDRLDFR